MDYKTQYQWYLTQIEGALEGYLQEELPQKRLLDAMTYSLMAGGKRIRPVLTLAFCDLVCGQPEVAIPYGCSVESLHTYSLIHDDLPCMDDDDLRRGKPSCHKQFDECTATLAGDALQAFAFQLLASAKDQSHQSRSEACLTLALGAGAFGMCGGQQLDMDGEGQALTLEQVSNVHKNKTAALLEVACVLGLLAGGLALDDPKVEGARRYAQALGMAFQLQDDILDATATTEMLGKPAGSDEVNHKTTYVTLLGIEECEKLVGDMTEQAKKALFDTFENPWFLCELADQLAKRTY